MAQRLVEANLDENTRRFISEGDVYHASYAKRHMRLLQARVYAAVRSRLRQNPSDATPSAPVYSLHIRRNFLLAELKGYYQLRATIAHQSITRHKLLEASILTRSQACTALSQVSEGQIAMLNKSYRIILALDAAIAELKSQQIRH